VVVDVEKPFISVGPQEVYHFIGLFVKNANKVVQDVEVKSGRDNFPLSEPILARTH
jgi:hypothetical protein